MRDVNLQTKPIKGLAMSVTGSIVEAFLMNGLHHWVIRLPGNSSNITGGPPMSGLCHRVVQLPGNSSSVAGGSLVNEFYGGRTRLLSKKRESVVIGIGIQSQVVEFTIATLNWFSHIVYSN